MGSIRHTGHLFLRAADKTTISACQQAPGAPVGNFNQFTERTTELTTTNALSGDLWVFSWSSPRVLGVNKSDRAAAAARSCFPPSPSACHLQRQHGLRSGPLRQKARNGNGDGSVRRTQTSTTRRRRPRLSGGDSEQTRRVTFEAGHGERCLR